MYPGVQVSLCLVLGSHLLGGSLPWDKLKQATCALREIGWWELGMAELLSLGFLCEMGASPNATLR